MKKETLEEAAFNFTAGKSVKEVWSRMDFIRGSIFGAEWQAERMYSEEEVIEILTQRCKHFGTNVKPFNDLLLKQDLEWFDQFKKK